MTNVLAQCALLIAAMAYTLGNFWYVYWIWPHSWKSFALFGVLGVVLTVVRVRVDDEQRRGRK